MRVSSTVGPRARLCLSLMALALAASAIGIFNGFAYDDRYIVLTNPSVSTLHGWWHVFQRSYWPVAWSGDGYRPLTILAFAVEWAIGRGAPMTFHVVNVVLYMLDAALVFLVAEQFLPRWAAWLAAALFAVHPVHVEAVANTVGQSEVMVALFVLAAVAIYLRVRQADPQGSLTRRSVAAIGVAYVCACLAKEHGVVLPALLVAAEWLLVADSRSWRDRVLALRPFYLLLTAIAVAYLAVHTIVLSRNGLGGFAPFVPFRAVELSNTDRVLTMFGVVPDWIRLFYWPVRLSSEYAPPAVQLAHGPAIWQLPGLLLLAAAVVLPFALARRRPVASFGIAWVCISLLPASNLLIPAGFIIAERTLFLPSVGAMLVAADVAVWLAPRLREIGMARVSRVAVAIVIAAAAARSELRSSVWRTNDTLFNQAVQDQPLDYRAHYMLGAWDFEQKRLRDGEHEYWTALKLFPYDPFIAYNMATQYRLKGNCASALALYKWAYDTPGGFTIGHGEYGWCLLTQGHFQEAKTQAFAAMRNGDLPLGPLRYLVAAADSGLRGSPVVAGYRVATVGGTTGKVPETMQKTGETAGHPPGQ